MSDAGISAVNRGVHLKGATVGHVPSPKGDRTLCDAVVCAAQWWSLVLDQYIFNLKTQYETQTASRLGSRFTFS